MEYNGQWGRGGEKVLVELSGFLGMSHLVGHESITGRITSGKHVLVGKGRTGSDSAIGIKSRVALRFKGGAIIIHVSGVIRAAGGSRTRRVCALVDRAITPEARRGHF